MSDPNALEGKVHPSNQGDAPTCTRHAIAKAIVQHAHYHKRYDFNQDYVLGVVENFRLTLEAVCPSEYDGQQFHFMDGTYHPKVLNKHYTITTKVAEIPVPWDEDLRQLKERQRILEEERKAEAEKRLLFEEARKAEEKRQRRGEQTRLQMKNNEEKKSYNGAENTTSVLLKKIFTFALIPPFAAFLLVLPKPGIVWAMSGVGALFVLGVNLLTEPVDSSITKEDVAEALLLSTTPSGEKDAKNKDVDEALLLSTIPPWEKEAKNEDYDRAAPPGGRPNFHLEYVLVYDTGRTDAHNFHCVFVKSIKDGNFNCINSWRDIDPVPQVRIRNEENRLWKVNVEYRDPEIEVTSGCSQNLSESKIMQKLSESVAPSSRIDAKSINKDEVELTLKENNIDRITHLYVIDDDGVEDVFSNGFRIKNSQEEGGITVLLKNIDRKKKFKVAVRGIVRDGDNEKEISLTCDKEIETNQDVDESLLLSTTPPWEKEAKNEDVDESLLLSTTPPWEKEANNEDVDESLLLSTIPPGEKEAKNEDVDEALLLSTTPPGETEAKNEGSFCLDEVLEYISQELTKKESKKLLKQLSITDDNSQRRFSESLEDISWLDLKRELQMMGKYELVDHIIKKTLITKGLKAASDGLRRHYVNDLIHCLEQPLSQTDEDTNSVLREDVFIDLVVLPSSTVDKELSNSDRAALMEQQYIPKTSPKTSVNNIFSQKDEFFVRGIGGIGKTALLEMLNYKWAKGELDEEVNKWHWAKL